MPPRAPPVPSAPDMAPVVGNVVIILVSSLAVLLLLGCVVSRIRAHLVKKQTRLMTANYPEMADQKHVVEVQMEQRLKKMESGEIRAKKYAHLLPNQKMPKGLGSSGVLPIGMAGSSAASPTANRMAPGGLGYINENGSDKKPGVGSEEAVAIRMETAHI